MKYSTSKLFFRKYAFKVELACVGSSFIKLRGANYVIKEIESGRDVISSQFWRRSSNGTKDDNKNLLEFTRSIAPLLEKKLKCRAEGSHFNFFLDNRTDFDYVISIMSNWIENTWDPQNDKELDFLIGNKRKIIVDKIPYEKYVNKVVFKTDWPANKRQTFLGWLNKYPIDDFKVSPSTERYLNGSTRYCAQPFVYIADPKMLTMLTLFAGDHVSYIEEFVPRHTLVL
jgi:hypothetical protein